MSEQDPPESADMPGVTVFHKIGNNTAEAALDLWRNFVIRSALLDRQSFEAMPRPMLGFSLDDDHALSITAEAHDHFTAVLWQKYGTITLYERTQERAEALLLGLFKNGWNNTLHAFESDPSAVVICGEKNPIKRWWRRLRRSFLMRIP